VGATLLALVPAVAPALAAAPERPAFPLHVSDNHRYFVDAAGKPFLYHADTGWQVHTRLTLDEAREYLTTRRDQGFNTIQTQIVMAPEHRTRDGVPPFDGASDFRRPNEAYHDHVARVIEMADSLGLLVVMSQPWLGCCEEGFGNRPDKPIQANGPEGNRSYGRYLGRRFARFTNLMWIVGGDNDPKGDLAGLQAFAEGLRETAPAHQLLAYHASPPHSSTDIWGPAPWLGFSFIYTYWRDKPGEWVNPQDMLEVYEAALREYNKTRVLPFVLGEAQYEGFSGNDIGTPFHVRRQPYWTMLSGGAGHAYGSQLWNFPAHWREIVKWPGAAQLRHFRSFFEAIPWWRLVPDQRHRFVVAGYGTFTKPDYVTTAVSDDATFAVSYLAERRTIVADLTKLKGPVVRARWFCPRTGEYREAGSHEPALTQLTPPTNEDWALLLESETAAAAAARRPRRFFSDDSFWNRPLPEKPEIDPRSDEWIAILAKEPSGAFFGVNTDRYTIPVYEVDASTPRHAVGHREVSQHFREVHGSGNGWFDEHSYYGHGPGFGEAVPIPKEARSDPEEDAHIVLVDWEANRVWDAWGLKEENGRYASFTGMTYAADGSGVFDATDFPVKDGESVHFHGPSRAAGVPAVAGLVLYDEAMAGEIRHKLAIATRFNAYKEFVPPAVWTDGVLPGGIPEGAVLQLDPALDLSRFDLTPQERAVAVAAQRYGMVVVDQGGANALYAQGLYPGMARSWEGKLRGWKAGIVGIPIHHYRVLAVGEPRRGGLSSEALDRHYFKVRSR
jgi:hypothetical protein